MASWQGYAEYRTSHVATRPHLELRLEADTHRIGDEPSDHATRTPNGRDPLTCWVEVQHEACAGHCCDRGGNSRQQRQPLAKIGADLALATATVKVEPLPIATEPALRAGVLNAAIVVAKDDGRENSAVARQLGGGTDVRTANAALCSSAALAASDRSGPAGEAPVPRKHDDCLERGVHGAGRSLLRAGDAGGGGRFGLHVKPIEAVVADVAFCGPRVAAGPGEAVVALRCAADGGIRAVRATAAAGAARDTLEFSR